MSSWNDDAPSPSRRSQKPAKNAEKKTPAQASPKSPPGSLPQWNDGVPAAASSGGPGLWQTLRHNRISQGLLIFLLGLSLLLGLVAFIGIQLGQEDVVPVVSIAVNGYENASPWFLPNAMSQTDVDRIARGGQRQRGVNPDHLRHWTPGVNESVESWPELQTQLRNGLNAGEPGGPGLGLLKGNQRNQILFLSLHLATNGTGEAVLMFPSDTRTDSRNWTPLTEVLTTVSEWRALKSQPKSPVSVLLILDCGRQRLNPYLAVSTDGLTSAIRRAFDQNGDAHLFGLVSQADGQQNWVAPELKGSIFAVAVARALSGRARSEQVTLAEFSDAVIESVSRWTDTNRGESQTPVFVAARSAEGAGVSTGFPLLAGETFQESPAESWELSDTANRALAQHWRTHAGLRDGGGYRVAPAEFALFEQELLASEQAFLLGLPFADPGGMSVVADQITVRSPSLAMMNPAEARPTNDQMTSQVQACQQAWLRFRNPRAEPGVASGSEAAPPSPVLSAWAIREWLLQKCEGESAELSAELLKFADSRLTPSPGSVRQIPQTIEAHFVRMLAESLPWRAGTRQLPLLRRAAAAALRCRFKTEEVIAMLPARSGRGELRPMYLIQSEMEDLDRRRRLSEDALFSGRTEELLQAEKTLNSLESSLDRISATMAEMQRRISDGEAVLARAPAAMLLAESVSRADSVSRAGTSPRAGVSSEAMQQVGSQSWLTGDSEVYASHREDFLVDALQAVRGEAFKEGVPRSASGFLKAWHSLQSSTITGEERNGIRQYVIDFLNDPRESAGFQIVWPDRTTGTPQDESRFSKADPDQETAAASAETPDTGRQSATNTSQVFGQLRQYLLAQLRPLLTDNAKLNAIESRSGSGSDAEDLRQLFELMNQSLIDFRARAGAGTNIADLSGQSTDSEYRALMNSELLIRLCSPLSPVAARSQQRKPGTIPFDVISLRRHLDERNRLLWQSKRILDDFWGLDTAEDRGKNSGRDSWFGQQVPELLKEADRLAETHPALATGRRINSRYQEVLLSDLLEKRTAVSRQGVLQIQTEKPGLSRPTSIELLTPSVPETPLLLTLVNTETIPGSSEPYIDGQCVVFETRDELNSVLHSRDAGSSDADNQRLVVPLKSLMESGTSAGRWIVRIPAELESRRINLSVYFRGHVSETMLRVEETAEQYASLQTFRPQFDTPPRVTLLGDPPNLRPRVMFVLDCSATMGLRDVKGAEADNDMQRGEVCRTALMKTLEELLGKEFDVGLTLFGHRAYWVRNPDKSYSVRYTRLAKRTQAADEEINPDKDAEVRFPLEKLDRDHLASIERVLEEIGESGHPRGSMSPLYLAMEQALNEFLSSDDELSPRFLVVITDGLNEVSDPKARAADRTFPQVKSVLTELWNRHKGARFNHVRCHLVYLKPKFDNKEDELRFNTLQKEFKEFEQQGRGGLFTATDSSGISQELLNSLDWIEFEIPESGSGPKSLDGTIPLPNLDLRTPKDVQLRVSSRAEPLQETQLTLEGGEKIEYIFRHEDRTIIFPEFAPEQSARVRIRDGFRIKALAPVFESDGFVTFPISIQKRGSGPVGAFQFTRRPASFHAEITGIDGPRNLGTMVSLDNNTRRLAQLALYDRIFQKDTPVPVIPLTFPVWTRDKVEATVELWFRKDPIPAEAFAVHLTLKEARDLYAAPSDWRGSGKLSVQKFATEDRTEIRVRQEGIEDSQYFEARVELSVVPDEIERRFFVEPQKAVVHSFFFDRDTVPDESLETLQIIMAEDYKNLVDTIHATAEDFGGAFRIDAGRQD